MAFHSTHRKGNQSKLLFFHLKGSRFSSWGLLHCDDRRSPWWASRDRPQHYCSCSDTVLISMNFNSYARLYFSSFLFFSVFVFFIHYTSVSCVWFLLPYVNLQSNWAWKPLKLGLSILFRLCSRHSNVNYCAWHFCRSLLACSEISLSIYERKARKKCRKRSDTVQFGRWRDSFSSVLCSILS